MQINTLKLAEKLILKYEETTKIQDYYGLLAYYAFCQTAILSGDEKIMAKCKEYLGMYPNNFDHPHYNFESYRVGGNGKAFLAMKGLWDEEKENLREYAELTLTATQGENGIMSRPNKPHELWIDIVTCTTPFMLFIGLALGEEKYIDFGAEQCFKMYDLFLDGTCGLLHQSKGFRENREFLSADHWSRGNGWGYVGLAELIRYLPENSKHMEKALKYYKALSEALLPYQTEKGLWRQEITEPLSWEESSGTGLILYCMGIGINAGVLKEDCYKETFERGIKGLVKYCINEDFSTERSCPGCLCPGNGKEKGSIKAYITEKTPVKNELHSFGCIMLALNVANEYGIIDVEL